MKNHNPKGLKNDRFREMDESGDWMLDEMPIFERIMHEYHAFEGDKLIEYCLTYLKEKIGKKPLRAYFFRKLYEYLQFYLKNAEQEGQFGDQQKVFSQKLPFVFEMVITIQYLHNHILDEKYDTKHENRPKIAQNLISSNIIRELLFIYTERELKPVLGQTLCNEFEKILRRLLLWVDLGQHIDKEVNHYKVWKAEAPILMPNILFWDETVAQCIKEIQDKVLEEIKDKPDFVKAYFQRIYLTNVYFFRAMVETLGLFPEVEKQHIKDLEQFSIQYGFMLQVINDYADFAYTDDLNEREMLRTAGKKTTDVFSDLYNFNITLPLIYHLNDGAKRKIESYLEGGKKQKKILTEFPRQIRQEITDSGGIRKCINRSRELSLSARRFLDEKNPVAPYFFNMCDMALDNKFYKLFK